MCRSLGSDTSYVWGPPGTGKTATLARIVEAHYRAGRSVLLVSNTNIAVDTALERVAERLKGESDFHQGLVIRQGPVVKEELRQRFGPQVILEEIVARLGESLRREKEQLTREAAPLEAEEGSLIIALKNLERLAQARETLSARERAREATRSNATAREREAERHRASAARFRADLERACSMGAVRRFFSGLNPERLERDAASSDRAAQAAAEAARALATDIPKYEAEIKALRSEIEELLAETRRYPPESEIRSRLDTLRGRLGQIRERITAIERELAELEQQVLARCRILATTVYRTYLGKSAPRQFDAVVIDEASMLMPPLVYYAAGLATLSVTVAGDFRQLPPIVMSDEALAERDWVDGLHRVLPVTFDLPENAAGAFTEGTFYPAFLKDLARARESIVIFSPFATGAGTGRWIDPLRAALARGVRVRILTRPPEEWGGGGTDEVIELVRALRDLGVTVDLRARMHEKIAILDGRPLWHGSLNIFSHRDTHESMLRIESPAACSQLARFLSTPTGGRGDETPTLDAPENPQCPRCRRPTIWNNGRYGIYFECEDPNCDRKLDARRRGRDQSRSRNTGGLRSKQSGQQGRGAGNVTRRPCPQSDCGGQLRERKGATVASSAAQTTRGAGTPRTWVEVNCAS